MARGPEGKIQDAVLKYAKSKGLLYKKNEVGRYFVSAGWPDVVFYPDASLQGRVPFFIEFKAPGGKLTPLQAHMRKQLEDLGYTYYVVDDVAKGKKIIDEECS